MKYCSTRNSSYEITAAEAIVKGLAEDGGLFVPTEFPSVSKSDIDAMLSMDYRQRAAFIMKLFLDEFSEEELIRYARQAYSENYDVAAAAPVTFDDDATGMLELWHGPTCAFKDMALQMLPYLLTSSLKKTGEGRKVCILVATSGDTGKAALEGFKDVEGTGIFVYYPLDGVSDVQKLQMITQEGKNVGVCAVEGNFDDAQTGVKKIFQDKDLAERLSQHGWFFSSANSINWGRLLPQVVYYFSAYCDCIEAGKIQNGDRILFSVPTGNFGDILAGWIAKKMGLPVEKLVCASNINHVLTDFLTTGTYDRNRDFHCTISPSMDILISSNLERLLFFKAGDELTAQYMKQLNTEGRYSISSELLADIRQDFACGYSSDEDTKKTIKQWHEKTGNVIDPHTAVALKVLDDYRTENGYAGPAIVVSTASPFKFAADVLEALGGKAGNDPVKALEMFSGLTAPRPLRGLRERAVRFKNHVPKEKMPETACSFLMDR